MPPLGTRLLTATTWTVLTLGIGAGGLYLQSAGGPEYAPVARLALGISCLALGYLLGQAVRPLNYGRAPIPVSADAPEPPAVGIALLLARGFASGFWTLVTVGVAALLLHLGTQLPWVAPLLLPATPTVLLLFGSAICLAVPLATARGMTAGGAGRPGATLTRTALAYLGGWGLVSTAWMLLIFFQAPDAGGDLAALLALVALPIAAVGTPALARSRRPRISRAGSAALMLATLPAAWLLFMWGDGWISSFGPGAEILWLLPLCLMWGSAGGAVLAVAASQRRARRLLASAAEPRIGRTAALAAVGVGLLLLIPLRAWLLSLLAPTPPAPPPASAPLPDVSQPGTLPLPGPTLVTPAAGATITGPYWTFRWDPPQGAGPGQPYQFALWLPGATTPITQFLSPDTQAQVEVSPNTARQHPGAWTWRVRAVRTGEGAGQWSEARPFTPGGR